MLIYMNFNEVRGPYGGANTFLRTLRRGLLRRGVRVTSDPDARFDIAFLNALTNEIDVAFVRKIAAHGRPVVHRKVGYRVSGAPEMRRVVDGVVWGDKLQIEFTPFLTHTIFQSRYSRDVFLGSGFQGSSSVIHNGVDEEIFNLELRAGPFGLRRRPREFWNGRRPLRVLISTWSTDENKGFPEYRAIDKAMTGRPGVELTLVGRVPEGTRFRAIRVLSARPARALANVLKRHDTVLQLARYETCSNALIEGINCGLPAVFLDSGSNAEIAGSYGVPYEGDLLEALDRLSERYDEIVEAIPLNPYRISLVVERYIELFERLLSRAAGRSALSAVASPLR